MKSLKNSVFFKVAIIVIIALLLLIPSGMIQNLVRERENTQKEAIYEVSSKWASEQVVSGPYLSIPYKKYVRQYSKTDSITRVVIETEYIHLLPAELKINSSIIPEKRHRGIYDIVVYTSAINVSGNFEKTQLTETAIPFKDILFDKAVISIGISDLRGIEKQVELKWNNSDYLFNPGVLTNDIVESGIHSAVNICRNDSCSYTFSFDLRLKGSQKLYFVPVGKTTDVKISSIWNNPSFNGAFLPDYRTVSQTGFTADWNILHLNRNYPQMWLGNKYSVIASSFGIDLLLPVDSYQKSMRTSKYALLFIAFTFIVFFFVEVLNKTFIHPVQYILVGIALVVFYTLLLSISEYFNFNNAFIISALATLGLIFFYVKAILKSFKISGLISGILFILYSFIFVIIQLQDYAMLIGSIGVFFILAVVMFLSRKIDWYKISMKDNN